MNIMATPILIGNIDLVELARSDKELFKLSIQSGHGVNPKNYRCLRLRFTAT